MFEFITKKPFYINLLAAIALLLLLLFIFFTSLSSITRHNKTIKVPQVTGKTLPEAKNLLEAEGFEVAVQDSIYNDTLKPLAVTRQSPESDENVKINRTIYLTINRSVPPMIDMPDLRGFSFKSAQMYLNTLGLKLGDTSFVPDIAKNAVKEQLYNSTPVSPGTKIRMGSVISFVLGSGIGNEQFNVPDLIGMTVDEARSYLSSQNIGLGAILVNDFIKDTAFAFIVKQSPATSSLIATGEKITNKISPGQLMDVWISMNPPVKDSTGNLQPDELPPN
ncbi:MAG: PASTA domain-containing protein [Parafilimonas sp.]